MFVFLRMLLKKGVSSLVMFYSLLFFLGASLASFFMVVGERKSKGQSIIFPNSHCGVCHHELSWFELVPVISYLFLDGRCLICSNKISNLSLFSEVLSGWLLVIEVMFLGIGMESVLLCVVWFKYIVIISKS